MRSSSGDRKAQLISEATRLFSRDGFDRVTVKQLADACGITEPAVYRHFPSKEALYNAVLNSISGRLAYGDLFATLEREEDIEALLATLARHVVEFFSAHEEIYRLLLYSVLHEHTYARQVYDNIRGAYVRFLAAQLERLRTRGTIMRTNEEIVARCFVGVVFDCALSGTLWKGLQGRAYPPAEIIATNVPIFARGLRARS